MCETHFQLLLKKLLSETQKKYLKNWANLLHGIAGVRDEFHLENG